MKDAIKARLNKIDSIEDKIILKNIVTEVLASIYNTSINNFKELEERVYSELLYNPGFGIYGTIASREEYDSSSEFFFAMNPLKVQVPIYNLDAIKRAINSGYTYTLFDVYFDCSYELFYDLLSSDRTFTGIISTDFNEYKAKFKVVQNFEYINMVEDLYKLFAANNVEWTTVNFPYLWRFVDIVIIGYESSIEGQQDTIIPDENITSLSIDFEEYSKVAIQGMLPVWNIRSQNYALKTAPVPVENYLNYEHYIEQSDIKNNGGLLIDFQNLEVSSIRKTEDQIIVVTDKQKIDWKILNIVPPANLKLDLYTSDIFTNTRTSDFINSFANTKSKFIKSKSELNRLVNSLQVKNHIKFVDIELHHEEYPAITINLNYFIEDEIRDMNSKIHMLLLFEATDPDYLFNEDIMNFVVSEVQMYFPEYKCVGELL